ncbi:MAG: maltose alpha-D-glucosyltransferase [Bacteroidales bacterium]|nr:maltose alpha-D-glucosyltransferase [Bacteroidales bacterium]
MLENNNPLWYKDAVIYQLHVRSFYDSNSDGIGDFKGLIQKLDYVQNLGVNTLWLLPFYPSPLKDGGYDIADFNGVHPSYGTLADFKRFVKEAHRRGLRIITELVLNHTSTEHKWFQRARKSKPGSTYRDFYVWSDTPEKYQDARIIFQDFEVSNWTYDHEAKAYYWHRFYSHQPDLNFENPKVKKEILKALDFWFQIGVDGFRLDAVPYLFEAEGTNCENLPETHKYLKELRKYVDDNYQDKLLLAEANQWPNDASDYFGSGDECHMAFHFPLMPRMYMALRMEDRFPIVDIIEQTPQIPDNCQWAIFLRNHDELTLEMVSDEERDYMYKSFADDPRKRVNVGIRRRLFPLFGGDLRTIELLNFLLLSMPGTPIIYYGDEIGMGDNYYLGDRDGVRTPMQWSPDKNAGFSSTDPQKLFLPVIIDNNYHYTSVNVENQERNPSSFLWWQRRVIAKRNKYKAFGRGSLKFINTSNPKVLAFVREYKDETILIVVNLSRYSQHVEIDLQDYAGSVPMEIFSRNDFRVISDQPWEFSMQFKNYFWFLLRRQEKETEVEGLDQEPLKITNHQWAKMASPMQRTIRELLYDYIIKSRWFKGNVRKLREINIIAVIALPHKECNSYLFIVKMDLIEASEDIFLMPVSIALNNKAIEIRTSYPESVIKNILIDGEAGILYDGVHDNILQEELFGIIRRRTKVKGVFGEIEGSSGGRLRLLGETYLKPHVIVSKHTNTSVSFGDKYFFKIYRNPQQGENPDVEIIKNLSRYSGFDNIPLYAGRLDYNKPGFENTSLAILVDLIPNVGDAWKMTQTAIESFFDRVLTQKFEVGKQAAQQLNVEEFIEPFFLEMIALLGRRTAEMHLALASLKAVKGFEPEDFSLLYQKSLNQSLRTFIKRAFSVINEKQKEPGVGDKAKIQDILDSQSDFFSFLHTTLEAEKLNTRKIRIHGSYKLDKLLFTGKDFIVTDFEGDKNEAFSIRKLKHCPLKDVASMLNSFHLSIYMGYLKRREFVPVNENYLQPMMDNWYEKISSLFIQSYIDAMANSGLIPKNINHTNDLINLFMLEKSIQELRHFSENQPELVAIPVNALQRIRNRIKLKS